MTIKQAITKGMIMLKSNNVESPKLKARLLLQYVLDKPRQYIIVYDNKEIDKQQQWQYFVNIEKLTKGIPLQHITHRQELVPNADITAVDISEKALEIAQKNAEKLEAKINFVKSNLFDKLDNKKFDIIVSNPPYIRKDEIKKLSEEVQKEPKIALDGGEDGLDFYRIIAEQAINYLKTGSFLCFEIGYNQKNDVIKIIEDEQNYKNTYCKKDLYGNDRIIITQVL